MSDQMADGARAESEAAGWFARLGNTPIATQTLRDFQTWRQSSANAAAYDALETRWRGMAKLANDPDIVALVAGTLKRPPARGPLRSLPGIAIWGAGLVAGCALAGWLTFVNFPTYSTHVGEQRLVILRDGSRVRLNTDSKLQVRFGLRERRVILAKGEAFFEAAHDAAKPFIVDADGASVRALGTKFDVKKGDNDVQVTLVQGRVQVARADHPGQTILLPNQRLTVTQTSVTAPTTVDAQQAASWTTGLLVFRGVPLSTAIEEVNRYTHRKIVLEGPPTLANQPVSGSFDPGDPRAFVSAATNLFDLRADWTDDDQVRLSPRAAAGS